MTCSHEIKRRAIKAACRSSCRYRISALGFNHKGDLIYVSTNKPRFKKEGGSVHAEMDVMHNNGDSLRTIIICRVNKSGEMIKIDPCPACAAKASERGVKIVTLGEGVDV